jgi:hypothetical protein
LTKIICECHDSMQILLFQRLSESAA